MTDLLSKSFYHQTEGKKVDFKQEPKVVHRTQVSNSYPSYYFVLILGLSSIIGTLGLAADSTVVIVGAMLIAPLMKPIISIAYAVVRKDWKLKIRSIITLLLGSMVTIFVAYLIAHLLSLTEPTEQILLRVKPSILDLGIAIAAGIAATLAATRSNIAEALPGVAVAVSLVPPLCVSGMGLATASYSVALGSFLLFQVNLVAMIFTAVIVLLLEGFGSVKHAWKTLSIIFIVALLQIIPLFKELKTLSADDLAQDVVETYLHDRYGRDGLIHPNDLERLNTELFDDHVFIFLEVKAPETMEFIYFDALHQQLNQVFDTPVNLKVQTLLSQELLFYSKRNSDGSYPEYGVEDLVPRR